MRVYETSHAMSRDNLPLSLLQKACRIHENQGTSINIMDMGVDHGGQVGQVPPEFGAGRGTLMQIVPPDFVI